ncbi:MAG TPA: hypothetical protein VNO26_08910 [Candidatus Limnocylindria bacterium]|nr:hypothetical protein [Candidatus Limnocylindria bacterium]
MTKTPRILVASLAVLGAAALPVAARPDRAAIEAARQSAFAEADADGSGTLTSDEFATYREAMRRAFAAARFAKIDANGDGVLTSEELDAAKPPHKPCGGPSGH